MNTIIETLKKDDYIIKEDVSFKTLTTYKTGGTCKFLISPKNVDALINLLKEIKKYNVKYKVLGNGSNILVSDDVFNGIVIKLDRLNNLKLDGKVLFVASEEAENLYMATRNLNNVLVLFPDEINVYDILNADYVVFDEASIKMVEEALK